MFYASELIIKKHIYHSRPLVHWRSSTLSTGSSGVPSRIRLFSNSAVRTLINAIDASMHWIMVRSVLDPSPGIVGGGDLLRFQAAGKKHC